MRSPSATDKSVTLRSLSCKGRTVACETTDPLCRIFATTPSVLCRETFTLEVTSTTPVLGAVQTRQESVRTLGYCVVAWMVQVGCWPNHSFKVELHVMSTWAEP